MTTSEKLPMQQILQYYLWHYETPVSSNMFSPVSSFSCKFHAHMLTITLTITWCNQL